MNDKDGQAKDFKQLESEGKDLIMFTITDLKLEQKIDQVHMVISLKRKIQTEMLTTYLPTLLLLIITYATTFFKADLLRGEPDGEPDHHAGDDDHLHEQDRGAAAHL